MIFAHGRDQTYEVSRNLFLQIWRDFHTLLLKRNRSNSKELLNSEQLKPTSIVLPIDNYNNVQTIYSRLFIFHLALDFTLFLL